MSLSFGKVNKDNEKNKASQQQPQRQPQYGRYQRPGTGSQWQYNQG